MYNKIYVLLVNICYNTQLPMHEILDKEERSSYVAAGLLCPILTYETEPYQKGISIIAPERRGHDY